MSTEAMKLAVRSLKELVPDDSDHAPAIQGQRKRQENALKALREALAEQPAQRTWVGLTDKDRNIINRHNVYVSDIISATEAKLREKNT